MSTWLGLPPPSRVCPCPALPVNRWYREGVLIEERVLHEDTGESDGEAFNASGADFWIIACPDCGLEFAQGAP